MKQSNSQKNNLVRAPNTSALGYTSNYDPQNQYGRGMPKLSNYRVSSN